MHPSTAAMQITKHRTPRKPRTKNILIKPTYEAIFQRNLSVVQHLTGVRNGAKLSPEKAFPLKKMLVSYKLYWVTSQENWIFANLDWSLRKTTFCGGTTDKICSHTCFHTPRNYSLLSISIFDLSTSFHIPVSSYSNIPQHIQTPLLAWTALYPYCRQHFNAGNWNKQRPFLLILSTKSTKIGVYQDYH